MLLHVCRKRFIKKKSRPGDTRSAPSGSCLIHFSILSLCSLLWVATMHDGMDALMTFWQTGRPFVGPYLSKSALEMYIRLVLILGGSSTGGSSARSSVLSKIMQHSIPSLISFLRQILHLKFILKSHGAPFILLTKSASHLLPPETLCTVRTCFCSLQRVDDEFSRSWYDSGEHSTLMQRLQLLPEIVVFEHHPRNLFSELHYFVAVTLVFDHLIRCFLS